MPLIVDPAPASHGAEGLAGREPVHSSRSSGQLDQAPASPQSADSSEEVDVPISGKVGRLDILDRARVDIAGRELTSSDEATEPFGRVRIRLVVVRDIQGRPRQALYVAQNVTRAIAVPNQKLNHVMDVRALTALQAVPNASSHTISHDGAMRTDGMASGKHVMPAPRRNAAPIPPPAQTTSITTWRNPS